MQRGETRWARALAPDERLITAAEVWERGTGTGGRVDPSVLLVAVAPLGIPVLFAKGMSATEKIGFLVIVAALVVVGLLLGRLLFRPNYARARSREGRPGSLATTFPMTAGGAMRSLVLTDQRLTLWLQGHVSWELPLSYVGGFSKDRRYKVLEAGVRLHFADGSFIRLVARKAGGLLRSEQVAFVRRASHQLTVARSPRRPRLPRWASCRAQHPTVSRTIQAAARACRCRSRLAGASHTTCQSDVLGIPAA